MLHEKGVIDNAEKRGVTGFFDVFISNFQIVLCEKGVTSGSEKRG